MISATHIDRLAGALMLDSVLRNTFLADRLGAIENFNKNYAMRYGEKPIELSEDELSLVLSLPATSVEQFYEVLELAVTTQFSRQMPLNGWAHSDKLLSGRREISAA